MIATKLLEPRNEANWRTYRRSITRKNLRVCNKEISSLYRTSSLGAEVMSLRVNMPSKVRNFNHELTKRNLMAFKSPQNNETKES